MATWLRSSRCRRDLPLSNFCQFLEPGPAVLLTTTPKSGANDLAMSWRMQVEFEPPPVGCVVNNLNYILAVLRATKKHQIAISALKEAPQVEGFGDPAGLNADRFNSLRAAGRGRQRRSSNFGV